MAEVDIFTSMNGLHEDVQNCDRGDSCKLTPSAIGENNNVLANELDGKLGDETASVTEENRGGNSCRNEALPTQDGGNSQMEIPRDTVAIEVDQTSSRHSLDAPVSLGNDEESKKECSNAENQECNTSRGNILPNASNLAQASNCSSENEQFGEHCGTSCQKQIPTPAALPNTVQDATQGSKQESGFPLPVITSLANSGTVSTYFTRSAKKARLTSSVPAKALPAQNTTSSQTASDFAASSKPLLAFAVISPQQGSEPATTVSKSSAPPVQDVLANSGTSSPYFTRSATKKAGLTSSVPHEALTAQSTGTACSIVMPGTPTATSGLANSSKPFSSVPAPIISTPTAAQDVSQNTAITSTSIDSPVSGMIALPIIPASLSNVCLFVKQDNPVSTSSVLVRTVTPQSLAQALATCTSTPATVPVPMSNLFVKHDDPVSSSSNPPVHIVTPKSLAQALATSTSTLATVPAPLSNVIPKQDDPVSTSSSPVHIVTPQCLAQALATCSLPITVSATSNTAVNSNTPVMIPSLIYNSKEAQPTIVSSAVSTTSSSLSLLCTSNSTALATIPIPSAIKSLEPEVPVKASNDETATANYTQNTTSGSVTSLNSSTALTDIPAIFPDFTPCPKCNSILVCSCPGPSGIGEGSGVTPTTCQAACQGVCTCDGMKVNQADGSNPCEEDVKPQIFPTVVSISWSLGVVFLGKTPLSHTVFSPPSFKYE